MQNFTWQQQLRYYWDMDLDDCLIRHSDAKVRYGYEYMGATRYVLLVYVAVWCFSTCLLLNCGSIAWHSGERA